MAETRRRGWGESSRVGGDEGHEQQEQGVQGQCEHWAGLGTLLAAAGSDSSDHGLEAAAKGEAPDMGGDARILASS